MSTLRFVTAALALMTLSSTALAGSAPKGTLNGSTLKLTCSSSCSFTVKNVGSRVHVFDIRGEDNDHRAENGFRTLRCDDKSAYTTYDRILSYAAADIDSIEIWGSNDNDYIYTNVDGVKVELHAGKGEDVAYINGDFDIWMGGGADCAYTRDGTGVLRGNDGKDSLEVASAATVFGNGGNDTIYGSDGDDDLLGGDGSDVIRGSFGADYIYGGSGNDVLYGDHGHDVIEGSDGNDWLSGWEGDDHLDGGKGMDTIVDSTGSNIADGGDDDDALDVSGDSYVSGGAGQDTCVRYDSIERRHCEKE